MKTTDKKALEKELNEGLYRILAKHNLKAIAKVKKVIKSSSKTISKKFVKAEKTILKKAKDTPPKKKVISKPKAKTVSKTPSRKPSPSRKVTHAKTLAVTANSSAAQIAETIKSN